MPFQRLTYLKNNKIQTVPTGHLCVICHHFIRLMSRLAMLLVRILPLTLRSHFKLSRAMKIIVFGLNICFQSGLTTNCVRNYPIKNATRIIIWNSNTILCTNLQTLYTGGLECLLCRSCFLL